MSVRAIMIGAALVVAAPALAATPIAGRYVTEDGSGIVDIGRCGQAVCGRLVKVLKASPGAPMTDVNNSDASLRSRPIVGLPILTGFADAGKDWRGRIYDPRNGKSYKSIVSREADGTLKVQGCIAFLCQTQVWRPVK